MRCNHWLCNKRAKGYLVVHDRVNKTIKRYHYCLSHFFSNKSLLSKRVEYSVVIMRITG